MWSWEFLQPAFDKNLTLALFYPCNHLESFDDGGKDKTSINTDTAEFPVRTYICEPFDISLEC